MIVERAASSAWLWARANWMACSSVMCVAGCCPSAARTRTRNRIQGVDSGFIVFYKHKPTSLKRHEDLLADAKRTGKKQEKTRREGRGNGPGPPAFRGIRSAFG